MVVSGVKEIIKSLNFFDEDKEIVELVVWFYDVGYILIYVGYEKESVKFVREFLENYDYFERKIKKVINMIEGI